MECSTSYGQIAHVEESGVEKLWHFEQQAPQASNPTEQMLSLVNQLHCIGQTYPRPTAKSFALEAGVKPRKRAHPEEVALSAASELQVDVLIFINCALDRNPVRACATASK